MKFRSDLKVRGMLPNKLDWMTVYVGFTHKWITSAEILCLYYKKKITPISDDSIVDLEVSKDDDDDFLSLLSKIASTCCAEEHLDFNTELRKSERIWQFSFLKQIADSGEDVKVKLRQVESLWASFGYPREWAPFIYYMPNETAGDNGEERVYENFLSFLRHEFNL